MNRNVKTEREKEEKEKKALVTTGGRKVLKVKGKSQRQEGP